MSGLKTFLQKHLDDVLIPVGFGLIVYGVAQVNIPAAWIAGGVLCAAVGWMAGRGVE